ncbi:MAG: hypothetical protein AAF602_11830 [Myxococcota bacterium]
MVSAIALSLLATPTASAQGINLTIDAKLEATVYVIEHKARLQGISLFSGLPDRCDTTGCPLPIGFGCVVPLVPDLTHGGDFHLEQGEVEMLVPQVYDYVWGGIPDFVRGQSVLQDIVNSGMIDPEGDPAYEALYYDPDPTC